MALEKKNAFNHNEALGNYFSSQTDRWRETYELNSENMAEASLLKLETIRRKDTVLYLLDKYSEPKMSILDIGCGSGIIMREVLTRGHNVVASDISEAMIREAKRNTTDLPVDKKKFLVGDMNNIAAREQEYDFILCVGVLQYQKNDKKSILEISRVLKNNGFAIITVPNLFRFRIFFDPYYYVKFIPRIIRKIHRKISPRPIDPVKSFQQNKSLMNKQYHYGQLNKIFFLANLEVVDCVSIGFSPLLTFWGKNILPKKTSLKIGNFLETKSSSKGFALLRWLPSRWVICLKKVDK